MSSLVSITTSAPKNPIPRLENSALNFQHNNRALTQSRGMRRHRSCLVGFISDGKRGSHGGVSGEIRRGPWSLRGPAGLAAGTAPCTVRPLGGSAPALLWEDPRRCHCALSVTSRAGVKSLLREAGGWGAVRREAHMPAPPAPLPQSWRDGAAGPLWGAAKHHGKKE